MKMTFNSVLITTKKNHYKRLKFNGINVLDSIEKKQKQAYARDWAISQCLDQSARLLWLTPSQADSGYFVSLTLPPRFHKSTFETANTEINKHLNSIKKDADRANITWLGVYKIHGHKDETPHLHIIYYVNDRDRDRLNQIFFKYFQNEEERYEQNSSINQSIWNFDGCLRYLFKDHGEPNVRIGFIGLRRDIKKVWHSLYTCDFRNKSLSYLSDDRIWMFRKLIRKTSIDDYVEHIPGYTLFVIRGFRDSRINALADRCTDISKTDFADAYSYLIGMWKYLNPEESVFKVEKPRKNETKRSYYDDFGYIYLYSNQEGIMPESFYWECELSRGQPPPVQGEE
ncbi:replication endonuclease [Acetobacter sp. AAB5]|uniref:replication endonuclease n=1 Tax=Acetobacter sp. AAB5 TaxID=3418370 RepID=UPI003CEE481A